MRNLLFGAAACCLFFSCNSAGTATATKDTTATAAAPATPPQSEFADARYTEMGKKALAQLSSGDIAGWMEGYADNAVYTWSSGDSLAGKAAIAKYWTERRGKVIDSIAFVNDIWLPIKVNQPQKGPDVPGIWLLSWYEVHVKYKNGARLGFWVHTDMHYNSADKIDRVIQYIDRAPINKALGH
jgi:hypothetical protein